MQLSSGAFKGLRFAGALLLCGVLTALGLVYWRSIEQQEQYLSGRNFRFLTVLAEQTEAMIVGQGRILQGALRDRQYLASKPAATWSSWLKEPDMVRLIPTLRDATVTSPKAPIKYATNTEAHYAVDVAPGHAWLNVTIDESKPKPIVTVRMPLATLLEPVFKPKLTQGAFDSLVFATHEGHIAFATGRRQRELQSTQLDSLLPGQSPGSEAATRDA